MASIPQLRKDIAALQADNKALRDEVVELRNAPERVRTVVENGLMIATMADIQKE